MAQLRATVSLPEHLARVIGERYAGESLSGRVADILDRYGEIIKRADAEVISLMTDEEILTVCAVIQGTLWQPASLIDGGIVADLEDAEDAYFGPEPMGWRVERKGLIEKVRALTYVQSVALVERCRKIMRREMPRP